MKSLDHVGLNLFTKAQPRDTVLKQMLQYLRASSPGKSLQFAYVESETSLIPHLTLWENLHLATGRKSWPEFVNQADPDWQPLIHLITNPNLPAREASCWERFTVSLIKAAHSNSPHVLVDVNEDSLSQLNLQNIKKMLLVLAQNKKVFVASANPDAWSEVSVRKISRKEFEFLVEDLNASDPKTRQTA